MFSVNIKGHRDPNNIEWVKLELIFYKSGYARVPKVLHITGLYKHWDNKVQRFVDKSRESEEKNKLLQREKLNYLKVAERWETEGKDWLPVELSHFYEQKSKRRNQYLSVSEMIDILYERFMKQERYKNGKILLSISNAQHYLYLKRSLERFTLSKYRRCFSKFMFRDITEQFLLDYVLYEKTRGGKNGTRGGINQKIKKLHAVCMAAKRAKVYNVNLVAFTSVKGLLRTPKTAPKAVSHKIIQQIEEYDRQHLTSKEIFYLDIFLFSYYTAGMSLIDICLLTKESIKENMLVYERTKCDRQARTLLIAKAKILIEKYADKGYMNYVFPIIRHKRTTQVQIYGKCKRLSSKINETLRKICLQLGIKQKICISSARSSYISKMIDEGYHPLQVAEQTGNTPQTIYRYYYTINDKEKMLDEMNSIF